MKRTVEDLQTYCNKHVARPCCPACMLSPAAESVGVLIMFEGQPVHDEPFCPHAGELLAATARTFRGVTTATVTRLGP